MNPKGWRLKVWHWLCRNLEYGQMLPRRYILARSILFPIDALRALLLANHPYKPIYNEWVINGVRYSARSLMMLAEANGEIFRIRREGDRLWFESLEQAR